MPRIFFHVDLDAFFASVEVRDNPGLAGKPVIVGAAPGRRGVVSTCSYEARAFGVHSAMPISEAFRRCPSGVYLPVRMERYCEVSARIMAILRTFTPDVRQVSVDEAFLDMTGTRRLWGPEAEAIAAIKRRVRDETGLTLSVGASGNAYVAKIASGIGKPDGATIVPEGGEAAFMRALPLEKLWGAGERTRERLRELGLATIAAVQDTPEEQLCLMLGRAAGSFLSAAAHGRDPGIYGQEPASRSLGGERTFERDTSDREAVLSLLRTLADEIAYRMWEEGARSRTIVLKLRFQDFSTITRRRTRDAAYSGPDDTYADALRLLDANWDGGAPLRLVGLCYADIDGDGAAAQGELFRPESDRSRKAAETVFEIQKKGRGKLRRARFIKPGGPSSPDDGP